jgi:hypothetical protein
VYLKCGQKCPKDLKKEKNSYLSNDEKCRMYVPNHTSDAYLRDTLPTTTPQLLRLHIVFPGSIYK